MMTFITTLKSSFNKPRISYWKVCAGLGVLLLVINAKTFYEINSLPDKAQRAFYLKWQFSWLYLVQQVLSLVLVSLLAFLVFNVVYQLTVQKAKLFTFVKVLFPWLVIMVLLDSLINYFFYRETFQFMWQHFIAYSPELLMGGAVLAVASVIIVKVAITNDISSRNRELELQNTKLALEKGKAEMDLLKAQVNPHFLYNSLNYLYAKSLPHSKDLSEGIMVLSEIMKYAFHNPDMEENGMVLLKDELSYIEKYLRMSSLRFGATFHVKFEQTGHTGQLRIIPFALFTIVENAIKHADASDPAQPIQIKLQVTGEQLLFSCENKKKPSHALKESTQVGIINLRGRLTAAYGHGYDLQINNGTDHYYIKLLITLQDGH
ncbi:histidine kinase [Chitinophaga skermanii]|uniref:Histidine kinase n=1 Tax=Chitinophaga skermanii TaxID=331697 RepID=A0A327QNQ9_9BACT|nr:sensor histidine kinase [Chitinophaga skermanii]RAJ05525.1 histidine kinase [Chitinophaga skermanii]